MDENKLNTLARAAYEKYAETQNWKNYAGSPIPLWAEVRADIKQAWYEAVKHVFVVAESME